ncbi:homeobox protein CDX-1 [Lingula anatina]|uniref:Homeobox protein CDX-1 n=1 Tax=Lingula anatina TaxID=7574 RepID=A0A1S3HPN8_LINAN|nr:homeobox protein CDX-1 [Lingula anatina]|eukprot:XP_013388018.1 homeobox protein CDX-1 [Lingula anatina]
MVLKYELDETDFDVMFTNRPHHQVPAGAYYAGYNPQGATADFGQYQIHAGGEGNPLGMQPNPAGSPSQGWSGMYPTNAPGYGRPVGSHYNEFPGYPSAAAAQQMSTQGHMGAYYTSPPPPHMGYEPYGHSGSVNVNVPPVVSAGDHHSTVSSYHDGNIASPVPANAVVSSTGTIDISRQQRQPYEWMKKQALPATPPTGKTRTKDKYRVVYSDHQRLELEKEFHYSKYITIRRKSELASNLALSERQVKIWFQNRRAKERKINKKKQMELGGQTTNSFHLAQTTMTTLSGLESSDKMDDVTLQGSPALQNSPSALSNSSGSLHPSDFQQMVNKVEASQGNMDLQGQGQNPNQRHSPVHSHC